MVDVTGLPPSAGHRPSVVPTRTADAQRGRGIGFQSTGGDRFIAFQAEAVLAPIDARQCGLDALQFLHPAFFAGPGHRLALQCIHARQPTRALLVQFHGLARLVACCTGLPECRAALLEELAKALRIDVVGTHWVMVVVPQRTGKPKPPGTLVACRLFVEGNVGERIQKVLARAGIGSRRAVEEWIGAGRVRVNGKTVEAGHALEADDHVTIDGRRYRVVGERRRPARWLRYHKPIGRVSTRDDPEGRPTVFDVLPKLAEGRGRWVSLGRLDVTTTGLMLFTDDGDLANALTHPSAGIEREYAVRVRGAVDDAILQRLLDGVELDDGPARFARIVDVGGEGTNHWYHVVLHEGRRNEVRRLWEAVGCQVARLTRVRFGPVTLPRHLRADRFEDLPAEEVRALLDALPPERRPGRGQELRLEPWQGRRKPPPAKGRAGRGSAGAKGKGANRPRKKTSTRRQRS